MAECYNKQRDMDTNKQEMNTTPGANISSDEDYEIPCTPCSFSDKQLPCWKYCLLCEDYLCKSCVEQHTFSSATNKHILLDKSTMPVKIKQITKRNEEFEEECEEHEHMMLSYKCKSCTKIGCETCMREQHNHCSGVAYIPDLTENINFDNRLTRLRKQFDFPVNRSAINKLNSVKSKIPRYEYAIQKYANDARLQVKQFHKAMHEALVNLEAEMESKIDKISQEDVMILDLLSKKCDIFIEKFEKLKSKISKNESNENKNKWFVSCYLMHEEEEKFEKDNIIEHLEKLLTVRSIKFKPGFGIQPSGKLELGDIKEYNKQRKEEATWKRLGTINTLSQAEITEKKEYGMVAYGSTICSVCACIILNDGRLLVADLRKRSIRLCDTTLNDERNEDISNVLAMVELENQAGDLAQINDNLAVATLPNEKNIQFLEIEDDILKTGNAIGVNGECYGIGCVNNKIFVGYRSPKLIEIMDLNGQVIKSITENSDSGFTFNFPRNITCDSERGLVYIADSDANAIVAINLEGEILIVFKDGGMVKPLAVTMGKEGSVLVAVDSPYSVQRIAPDFISCEVLKYKDDTWNIQHLAYSSSENRLFFGTNSNFINVREIN